MKEKLLDKFLIKGTGLRPLWGLLCPQAVHRGSKSFCPSSINQLILCWPSLSMYEGVYISRLFIASEDTMTHPISQDKLSSYYTFMWNLRQAGPQLDCVYVKGWVWKATRVSDRLQAEGQLSARQGRGQEWARPEWKVSLVLPPGITELILSSQGGNNWVKKITVLQTDKKKCFDSKHQVQQSRPGWGLQIRTYTHGELSKRSLIPIWQRYKRARQSLSQKSR